MAVDVKFIFDPFEKVSVKTTAAQRTEIKERIKNEIPDAITDMMSQSKSPVTGRKFKKKKDGKVSKLLEEGDLYNSIHITNSKGNALKLTVADDNQGKADGHNNFSGQSKLPNRPFIPNAEKKQKLHKNVRDQIDDIITEVLNGSED